MRGHTAQGEYVVLNGRPIPPRWAEIVDDLRAAVHAHGDDTAKAMHLELGPASFGGELRAGTVVLNNRYHGGTPFTNGNLDDSNTDGVPWPAVVASTFTPTAFVGLELALLGLRFECGDAPLLPLDEGEGDMEPSRDPGAAVVRLRREFGEWTVDVRTPDGRHLTGAMPSMQAAGFAALQRTLAALGCAGRVHLALP